MSSNQKSAPDARAAAKEAWNASYVQGTLPWEIGRPEPLLVEAVRAGKLPEGRLLELGCGLGTNARFLAESGWEVVAVDLAPRAIEMARERGGGVDYRVHDVLAEPIAESFDAVFDRGCFHSFDRDADRIVFVQRVHDALRDGGEWISLIGSTEGAPRDLGPPRRSARQIVDAIEPFLEILELRACRFGLDRDEEPAAWFCRSRRRTQPAQPPTHRSS